MEGVKFYLLYNNFIKKISFEKNKKVYERGIRKLSFHVKFVNVRQKLFELSPGNRL